MLKVVLHTDKVLAKINSNNTNCLDKIGRFCKNKMDEYVAVDTSFLKSRNNYKVESFKVTLINDCDYAVYQEFGTYKMKAQPFMLPSVFNHLSQIKEISENTMGEGL